jgi:hypothetical protein
VRGREERQVSPLGVDEVKKTDVSLSEGCRRKKRNYLRYGRDRRTWRRHWKNAIWVGKRGLMGGQAFALNDYPIGEMDTAHDAQLSLPWTRRHFGIGTRRSRTLATAKGRV